MGLPNEQLIPLNADHREMCRFPSVESSDYKLVWTTICDIAKDATGPQITGEECSVTELHY